MASAEAAQRAGPHLSRAAEAWEWISKLQTTGSVLQITAHPDDENGALLTLLGRGHGIRTALLSLTRGEAGANAIGPELFDALGVIRAAELEVAGAWYGLDQIYFTPLADYGYSKNLEEALRAWDEEAALADIVEVVRRERPMAILARFTGDPRDGHGQHQFAGRLTRRAFDAAPDLMAFPPREGRRPFLPTGLFLRARDEAGASEIVLGASRPWLPGSFAELAAIGLGYQRSQTRGVVRETAGRGPARLIRGDDGGDADLLALLSPERASLSNRFGPVVPGRLAEVLMRLDDRFAAARDGFDWTAPEAVLPILGEALAELRELLAQRSPSGFFDVRFELERKEEQLEAAIRAVAGIHLEAAAEAEPEEASRSPFAPPPAFGPATPGQEFEVRVRAESAGGVRLGDVALELPGEVTPLASPEAGEGRIALRFRVQLDEDAPTHSPHAVRSGLGESRYRAEGDATLAAPPSAATARLALEVPVGTMGEWIEVAHTVPVTRFEPNLPYGYERRELEILPPVSVAFEPGFAAFPADDADASFEARITATGHRAGTFRVAVVAPAGAAVEPESATVRFDQAGEQAALVFTVRPSALPVGTTALSATVVEGDGPPTPAVSVRRIAHRDLPLRYLIRPAEMKAAASDLAVPPGLRVGFVVGAGDEIPAALAALGAEVTLLDEAALTGGDLDGFDAVVTGTRAWAVRPDVVRASRRLLDYARGGGHLVVLYNTSELVPDEHAPFPGALPRNAEEVSEEDAEVRFLAPDHPLLGWPHRIGPADFEGWVEQRGSKFWSEWDPAYTALFEMADQGQVPQQGAVLTAEVGDGRYTYFALALHRQAPEGVPGAFRLLGNLIAARRAPDAR